MKGYPDHRSVLPARAKQHPGQTDLFSPTKGRRLSTEERYRAWRLSPDGLLVWPELLKRALRQAMACDTRIGSKQLVEDARKELKVSIDNRFTALIADDLVSHQALAPLIERRPRKHKSA